MHVPFYDLSKEYTLLNKDIKNAIDSVLQSQNFILGSQLHSFESEFAEYIGSNYCVGVGSGTDGLILSLMALGIKKGEEVITQANTFIATAYAISIVGAKPVLVDVDSLTHQMISEEVEKKITNKTKAIIPVHMFGSPAPIKEILKIAKKHKLFVIEDACQAHGGEYDGKKLGSFGDISVFSFYPSKNLGAYGDGGAICTNKKTVYKKLMMLRNYGQRIKYHHVSFGTNTRLDELQAAVLRVKLRYLDTFIKERNVLAERYLNLLNSVNTVKIIENGKSGYHLFVIKSRKRNSLKDYLEKRQIFTQIHYPLPIHKNPVYKDLFTKQSFPNSEEIAKTSLSLPFFFGMTERSQLFVADSINSFFNKK